MNSQAILVVLAMCVGKGLSKPRPGEAENETCGAITTSDKLFQQLYPNTPILALYPMRQLPPRGPIGHAADAICPVAVTLASGEFPNKKGSCPWDYVENYDETRIPPSIYEARCLCEDCLDPDDRTVKRIDMKCQPIMHPITVWTREGCINGYYKYRKNESYIQVGCQCVKKP